MRFLPVSFSTYWSSAIFDAPSAFEDGWTSDLGLCRSRVYPSQYRIACDTKVASMSNGSQVYKRFPSSPGDLCRLPGWDSFPDHFAGPHDLREFEGGQTQRSREDRSDSIVIATNNFVSMILLALHFSPYPSCIWRAGSTVRGDERRQEEILPIGNFNG